MSTGNPTSAVAKPVSRRDLLWLMLTGGAAVFGGGSLSWAFRRDEAARAAEARATALTNTLATSGGQLAEITDALRAAETEIARLAAELAQSQGLVAQYETDLAQTKADLGAARADAEALRGQLAESEVQRGALQGLVALLEGLEDVDLDDILQAGLTALMGVWAGLGGLAPVLRSGVELALGLLSEFEETLAALREKVLRGSKLLGSIRLDVDRIERASAQAVLTVGPLFEPMAQFATYLIEHLPFDISAPFEDTMGLVRRLLASVPNTIRHMEQLVIQPFERFLGQSEQGWLSGLTTPLREQLLVPAAEFLSKWSEADATLADKVLTPTTAALEKRARLRGEIVAYKSQHNLN